MNMNEYLYKTTKGQSRSSTILCFEGGPGSGVVGHHAADDQTPATNSTPNLSDMTDVQIMMHNPDNHKPITDIARQALVEVQELDADGTCKGACREISSEIYKKLKDAGYNKTIKTIEVALYDEDSISHGAVALPDDGLIIDTQVWQFTGMPYEKDYENPATRKVVFTEDEYKAIGFDIEDNRMAVQK